jgi:hypothetical protein
MTGNKIKSQGAVAIAKALETNSSVTSVDLSNNDIKSDEILLNEFTKRKINIHNEKLSPANSNTFLIHY